jgi:FtsH-binding integral membrane protein
MRTRYLAFLAIAIAGAFTVVASAAFARASVSSVALGVGAGVFIVSAAIAARYRSHLPSLITGALLAAVGAWAAISSQVFGLATVEHLTLANSLAISALAIVGLTAHELGTERVVHSLHVRAEERQRQSAAVA